jgi:hypothetical protein
MHTIVQYSTRAIAMFLSQTHAESYVMQRCSVQCTEVLLMCCTNSSCTVPYIPLQPVNNLLCGIHQDGNAQGGGSRFNTETKGNYYMQYFLS